MRSIRRAALALAVTLAFSCLALARDHDDHWKDKHAYSHHEENHGWDHVWNRGRDRDRDRNWNWGRDHDRDRNWNWGRDRDNDGWRESARERERERERIRHHEIWEHEHRNDGYYGRGVYNRYPGGYGYPNGGYGYPNGGYGYPGTVYGRGGYGGYGNGGSSSAGYQQGFQDGSYQARKDIAENKPFNPNPRGASHSDHGYHSSMGDKYSYQAAYNQGYHSGYQSNYGGGRIGRGWGF